MSERVDFGRVCGKIAPRCVRSDRSPLLTFSLGNDYVERRSHARLTLEADLAAARRHEQLRYGETETGPFRVLRVRAEGTRNTLP